MGMKNSQRWTVFGYAVKRFCRLTFRSAESKRIIWKLGEISDMSENGSHGRVLAKFDLISGPSTPSLTAAQFLCDGTTLSGIDFELAGPGYRLSLVKKRFFTGMKS